MLPDQYGEEFVGMPKPALVELLTSQPAPNYLLYFDGRVGDSLRQRKTKKDQPKEILA